MESSQRFPIRLAGMALFNAFSSIARAEAFELDVISGTTLRREA